MVVRQQGVLFVELDDVTTSASGPFAVALMYLFASSFSSYKNNNTCDRKRNGKGSPTVRITTISLIQLHT